MADITGEDFAITQNQAHVRCVASVYKRNMLLEDKKLYIKTNKNKTKSLISLAVNVNSFKSHHVGGVPGGVWIPSEYCNRIVYGHPQAVYLRR